METLYPGPIHDFLRRKLATGEVCLPAAAEDHQDFLQQSHDAFQALSDRHRELFPIWLRIGWTNPWIAEARDPPFTYLSFRVCPDLDELTEQIFHGNWALGNAFVLGELCFINQVDGGDEWLTIKGRTAFESITVDPYWRNSETAPERFQNLVRRFQRATEARCKALTY